MITKKSIRIIFIAVSIILLIPVIAMQFTPEVNWDGFDFLVAAILLSTFGFSIAIVWNKLAKSANRKYILIGIIILFLLLWAELAVGIFGSPLAGS